MNWDIKKCMDTLQTAVDISNELLKESKIIETIIKEHPMLYSTYISRLIQIQQEVDIILAICKGIKNYVQKQINQN